MGVTAGISYENDASSNIIEFGTVAESNADVVFASTMADVANYLRLKDGSPAVNAGRNNYIPSDIMTDIADAVRIQKGTVDLGAYESDSKKTQIIDFRLTATIGLVGETIKLRATTYSGLPVTYVSSAPDVAEVVDNGGGIFILRLVSEGTVIITASQSGDDNNKPAVDATHTLLVRTPIFRRVTTTGDAGNDGSSWTQAMTLHAALTASVWGDQVWIAAGTYKPDATDRTVTFSIPEGVLVYGGF